jgi:hypothetical protein
LRVTAAHEFFHAIQFNYDAVEDLWLQEATATWMEERYADNINDNRQYLSTSQLGKPSLPLDTSTDLAEYGNWIFFERLSQKYGIASVRKIWDRLDSTTGKANDYSIQGVRKFLAARGATFPRFYANFAAGNLFPAEIYPEGASYPKAPINKTYRLSKQKRTAGATIKPRHLSSASYSLSPAALAGAWKLKLSVDGPRRAEGPGAFAQVLLRNGTVVRKPLPLNSAGEGVVSVAFNRATVTRVTLTVANGGTQYGSCFTGGLFSCQGTPKNDGNRYTWKAVAIR